MNTTGKDDVIANDEISRRLAAEVPAWRHAEGCLVRSFKTTGWKATLMLVNALGYLCEVGWHHPELEVSFNKVTVKLRSHDVDGITGRDFELAGKIDEVIGWQPGQTNGALTGPPARQRVVAENGE